MASSETNRRLGRILLGIGCLLLAAAALFGAVAVPRPAPGGVIVAAVLGVAGLAMAAFGAVLLTGVRP